MSVWTRTPCDRSPPWQAARLLAGIAVIASVLTGCDSDRDSPAAAEPPATSQTPLDAAECVTVEHEDRKLGVTVPAGFTVATPPESAAKTADTYKVNVLTLAARPESGRDLPTAVITVYGYGPGEREGTNALEASVLHLARQTGGVTPNHPISTTPTTVAGTQGAAGGQPNSRALDHQSPDDVDSMLRWWTIPSDGNLFIVALATATTELDSQYTAEIPAGLILGGC